MKLYFNGGKSILILKEEILNNKKQKTALTLYNNFIETLTEKQIIMFEEVLDNLFELNDEFAQKDFKQGFKLGFNVAVDSLR